MLPDHFKSSSELTFKGLEIKDFAYFIEFSLSRFVFNLLILLLYLKIIWFERWPALILSVRVLRPVGSEQLLCSQSNFSDLVFWMYLCSARNLDIWSFLVTQKLEKIHFHEQWEDLFFFVLLIECTCFVSPLRRLFFDLLHWDRGFAFKMRDFGL